MAGPTVRKRATGVRSRRAEWLLKLYIAGKTPRSVAALANVTRICETHLKGQYEIEIVDLLVNPALAEGDQIAAVPSLVRHLPLPVKKIAGDLADERHVLAGLGVEEITPRPVAEGGAGNKRGKP